MPRLQKWLHHLASRIRKLTDAFADFLLIWAALKSGLTKKTMELLVLDATIERQVIRKG